MKIKFKILDDIKNIIQFGVINFENVRLQARNEALLNEIQAYNQTLLTKYKSTGDALEHLQVMRTLYRAIGLDPTKNRPSSEALLRRVLQGKELYQINSIVDVCNFCSLSFLLSIGLYDMDKISGTTIELRTGKANEGYAGIGKEHVNVDGRIALADEIGPFGNPSSDSDRTKITTQTSRVLFVVFAPADYDAAQLKTHIDFIEQTVKQYHDCEMVFKEFY